MQLLLYAQKQNILSEPKCMDRFWHFGKWFKTMGQQAKEEKKNFGQ